MQGELPICCVCGGLIDGEIRTTADARTHHPACKPAPPPTGEGRKVQSLGSFAERKARNVMHGRGQRQLEDDL